MPKGHGHSVLVFSLVLCVQRFLWLLWIFIGTANTLYVIKVFETSFKAICSCSLLQSESEIRKTSPPLHLRYLLCFLNYLIIIGFCFRYVLSNKTKTLFK